VLWRHTFITVPFGHFLISVLIFTPAKRKAAFNTNCVVNSYFKNTEKGYLGELYIKDKLT
jgi:hypothetical protein